MAAGSTITEKQLIQRCKLGYNKRLHGPWAVLSKIIDYAVGCTSGKVWLSKREIGARTGFKRRWVQRSLHLLRFAGLVHAEERPGRSNLYRLLGIAADYVDQQRKQKADRIQKAGRRTLDWINRSLRAGAQLISGVLETPNLLLYKKEDKCVPITPSENAIILEKKKQLAAANGASPDLPLSQLYFLNEKRLQGDARAAPPPPT